MDLGQHSKGQIVNFDPTLKIFWCPTMGTSDQYYGGSNLAMEEAKNQPNTLEMIRNIQQEMQ